MKNTAVVLAAGSGKRMGSDVKKQYMEINGKPLIYYSLKTFEESFIDDIILVTSKEDMEYVQKCIVDKFGFKKVSKIVEGGKERYHSVYNALCAINECDYVYIHDGARPCITQDILQRAADAVQKYDTAVIGVPSKDTIKIVNTVGFVSSTPDRNLLWNIQTPQVFRYGLIKEAYDYVLGNEKTLADANINITDDSMIMELFKKTPVKLVMGSYENVKVTTPSDILLVKEALL